MNNGSERKLGEIGWEENEQLDIGPQNKYKKHEESDISLIMFAILFEGKETDIPRSSDL